MVTSDQFYDLTETLIDLFKESRENYIEGHNETTDGSVPELHDQWLTPEEQEQRKQDASVRDGQRLDTPTLPDLNLANFGNDKSIHSEQSEDFPGQGENPLEQGETLLEQDNIPIE
jgi:isopenicillin N synthase-like dioxygenase